VVEDYPDTPESEEASVSLRHMPKPPEEEEISAE